MDDLDLTQLIVFDAMYRNRSVIKAARALDLPQSTLSRCLAKLRSYFNDPLFVKTQQGMEPTPVAETFAVPVSEMVRIYQTKLRNAGGFDPATTMREFKIAASDMGALLVLPALDRVSRTAAPFVRFSAAPLGRVELITSLETGEIDLAFGSFDELYGCVRSQTLTVDNYVCVTHQNRHDRTIPLSLQEFKAARHILVDARALGSIHQRIERRLLDVCPSQNVRLVAESFLVAGLLLDQDDFILTVPSRVASLLCERSSLVAFAPPIDLPEFKVTQYWHERYDREPGNQWLRRGLWQIFSTSREFAGQASKGTRRNQSSSVAPP